MKGTKALIPALALVVACLSSTDLKAQADAGNSPVKPQTELIRRLHNDHYGFTTGTPQHVQEFTGTFQRILAQHLISRLEYRHDSSNRAVFTKGTRMVLGQNTLTAGVVYMFDTRETK